ncbi:hypothetical protein BDV23DRAFT_146543 [Aspergillus alliaceus]|uniref:Uncharacterized protein n=1 Tax=Petromyces alliaceus TaxID=209559 RepID=A0A5N7CLZ1_PETAA|nr:hypothetical protein BDV23DRAFT_146543 [Aspergillus alliaceus]
MEVPRAVSGVHRLSQTKKAKAATRSGDVVAMSQRLLVYILSMLTICTDSVTMIGLRIPLN